jgi:hypothetical protein
MIIKNVSGMKPELYFADLIRRYRVVEYDRYLDIFYAYFPYNTTREYARMRK